MPRFLILISVVALACPVSGRADAKAELEKLQGVWKVTAAQRDGVEVPPSVREALTIEIQGNKMTIKSTDVVNVVSEITLDASQKPASVTLKQVEPKAAPEAKGIYDVTADRLRLCWARQGGERPKEFASKAGSKTVLFELTRKK